MKNNVLLLLEMLLIIKQYRLFYYGKISFFKNKLVAIVASITIDQCAHIGNER